MTQPESPQSVDLLAPRAPESLSTTKLANLWIVLTFSSLVIAAALIAPTTITLQRRLLEVDPQGAIAAVGIVVAAGMIAGALVSPLSGKLSDRTRLRFGMRRPWAIAGVAVGLIGTAGVAFSNGAATILIFWAVASLGYGIALPVPLTILTEQSPERHRGLMGFGISTAQAVGPACAVAIVPLFPESTIWPLMIPSIAAMVVVPLLMLITPDNRLTGPKVKLKIKEVLDVYWVSPAGRPRFAALMFVVFFNGTGFVVFSTYLYFILMSFNEVSERNVPSVMSAVAIVGAIATVGPGAFVGVLTDRRGRRRTALVVATVVIAGAMLGQMFIVGLPAILILSAVQSGAYGVMSVLAFAILAEVSDAPTAGRDAGMFNTVTRLAAALGPVAASLLIGSNPNNMVPVIYLSVALTLISAVVMFFTKSIK